MTKEAVLIALEEKLEPKNLLNSIRLSEEQLKMRGFITTRHNSQALI